MFNHRTTAPQHTEETHAVLVNLVHTRAAPLQGAAADSPRWLLASALLRALSMRPKQCTWVTQVHEVVAALATVPTHPDGVLWPAAGTLGSALTTVDRRGPLLGGQVNALTTPLWQQRVYATAVVAVTRLPVWYCVLFGGAWVWSTAMVTSTR